MQVYTYVYKGTHKCTQHTNEYGIQGYGWYNLARGLLYIDIHIHIRTITTGLSISANMRNGTNAPIISAYEWVAYVWRMIKGLNRNR